MSLFARLLQVGCAPWVSSGLLLVLKRRAGRLASWIW
jgi:hypothetical protein